MTEEMQRVRDEYVEGSTDLPDNLEHWYKNGKKDGFNACYEHMQKEIPDIRYKELKEMFTQSQDGAQRYAKKLTAAKEENSRLREALEWIRFHYNHPNHDHNWAFATNEKVNEALGNTDE